MGEVQAIVKLRLMREVWLVLEVVVSLKWWADKVLPPAGCELGVWAEGAETTERRGAVQQRPGGAACFSVRVLFKCEKSHHFKFQIGESHDLEATRALIGSVTYHKHF